MDVQWSHICDLVIQCLIFSTIGVAIFGLSFAVFQKLVSFSVQKEIADEHNTALAIVMAAVIIGIAMIVSAAVGG